MKDHHKDFYGFIAFLVLLFIAWVISGGPQHAKETGDAYNRFQEPIDPFNPGKTYERDIVPPLGGSKNVTY